MKIASRQTINELELLATVFILSMLLIFLSSCTMMRQRLEEKAVRNIKKELALIPDCTFDFSWPLPNIRTGEQPKYDPLTNLIIYRDQDILSLEHELQHFYNFSVKVSRRCLDSQATIYRDRWKKTQKALHRAKVGF